MKNGTISVQICQEGDMTWLRVVVNGVPTHCPINTRSAREAERIRDQVYGLAEAVYAIGHKAGVAAAQKAIQDAIGVKP